MIHINAQRGIWRGKTKPKQEGVAFNNVWVEGNLICSEGRYYIHPTANAVKVQNELGRLIVMHEVIPDTLGECSCIPDENNKSIFEGDVCTVHAPNYADDEYGVVRFDEKEAVFVIDFGTYTINFCDNVNGSEVEVIGNIHDNPNLL